VCEISASTASEVFEQIMRAGEGDVVIGESGENINPDTVEQLFNLDGARMLSILGLPGENGEELSMVIQLNPYATEETVAKLRDQAYGINATLPKTTAVRKFYCTFDDLAPPTAIKVGRYQLQKKIKEGDVKLTAFKDFRSEQTVAEGDSPMLHQVKLIIAEQLELPVEKVETNAHIFYDLGGTSIQYFSILSAVMEHFHITSFDKNEGYRYTPKEICEFLERYV
jgi:acyl carrier protein